MHAYRLLLIFLFSIVSIAPLYAQTATIGGNIFTGQTFDGEPDYTSAPPLTDAVVMVQNQHSGGAFITYGTVTGNSWTATVPAPGDYVVMFSATDHDLTSREFTVADGDNQTKDAYLPPLPLPLANLMVYAFYDNYVNGEDDAPDDPPINGVTFKVCPEDGPPEACQTGVSGSQATITTADGTVITETAGFYYFTGLPPGEVIVTSDPGTAYTASNQGLGLDASTEFYLMTSEEGGHAWDPKLYPGDPGTEDGTYLIWHGYVKKLGQISGGNPGLAGSIYGILLDADGNEAGEPFPNPGPPGVSPNMRVPDGFVVLFTNDETLKVEPVATTEADPVTGEYRFTNVPPGRYKLFFSDLPIDYVWTQAQVRVFPGLDAPASSLVPRFFARGWGHVYDKSSCSPDLSGCTPIEGLEVRIRYKSGSIKKTQTTDSNGWYNFDNLSEIEVMGHVDVDLPPNYRGAIVTDTFQYNLPGPYETTHNAMNRYLQWYTANYQADLYLEPIPASEGDVRGFVFNDHLAMGTWVGDGSYDAHEERTMHGVTVELYDAAGTTLLHTTTTGKVDSAQAKAQGWHQPYTLPYDELGGVYVGPLPGFYEFRGLTPGQYTIKVIPPEGFSESPVGSEQVIVTISGGNAAEHDFGINTLVPLAGEIEGGVFDDINIDTNPQSLIFADKAGIPGVPVGVYDHLGYFMGMGTMGNPLCYAGSTVCPAGEQPIQKPEMERRFAPGVHIYVGNDPSLPGYNPNYLPLALAYTFGQGKYKFEADWSLVPSGFVDPLNAGEAQVVAANAPAIDNVVPVGSYSIIGHDFGDQQAYSTVTLNGKRLKVKSWSDTEIHVKDPKLAVSGWVTVATSTGISNAYYVNISSDKWDRYMAQRAVYVGPRHPYATISAALKNLPKAKPRYIFVDPGTYNERIQITESDIRLIGAGPRQTIIDGKPASFSVSAQGFNNGGGPVIFIGKGGMEGGVSNIMISGFTVRGGTVKGEIGAGIFGDFGNDEIDINNSIIVHNGGYYGGGIWLHYSNHNVNIWSNTIAHNGNYGGYGGGISVNDEPEYVKEHSQPEHIWDDPCPPTCKPTGKYKIFNNLIYHNYSPDYGGGITLYEIKDRLIIYGNMVIENKAEDHGGGAFFEDTGPIELYGNVFLRNFAYDDGGAISFEDVGDGISSINIYNNLFAQNIADDHGENHARGGALAFDDTFYACVYNNTIVGNIVAGSYDPAGGGIDSERHGHEYNGTDAPYIAPGFSDPKIFNNIIWDNWRLVYDQPLVGEEEDLDYSWGKNYRWTRDDLHVDNPAINDPWQTSTNSESFSFVAYNAISDGAYLGVSAQMFGGEDHGLEKRIKDCRMRRDDKEDDHGRRARRDKKKDDRKHDRRKEKDDDHGTEQQRQYHVGNINFDPMFVNPPELDWHLTTGSPLLDKAPKKLAPKRDLDRLKRKPSEGKVEMGAYEYRSEQPNVLRIPKGILGSVKIPKQE